MAGRKEPVVAGVRGWLDRLGVFARGWPLFDRASQWHESDAVLYGYGAKSF